MRARTSLGLASVAKKAAPDKATADAAVGATAAIAAKRAAAPSWSTIRSTFDKMGGRAELNAKGEVVGYKYPTPANDEQRKKINNAVYEMWHPHRRISTDMGMERSARQPVTTLVDRNTGRTRQVRASSAEKVARKSGMVEVPNRKANIVYRDGKWWRYSGGGEWVEDVRGCITGNARGGS